MKDYLRAQNAFPRRHLVHLTQPDVGFRKNRALNRAIVHAATNHLVFIDGDCVPAVDFVRAHQIACAERFITAGRRLELGPVMTKKLVESPELVKSLSTFGGYLKWAPRILVDGGKNIESGLRIPWLDAHRSKRHIELVGCNFSAPRFALEGVNGFNEEYESPGLGEDSDIHWRMTAKGSQTRSVKFRATLFHLFHPRNYAVSASNFEIFSRCQRDHPLVAPLGLKR